MLAVRQPVDALRHTLAQLHAWVGAQVQHRELAPALVLLVRRRREACLHGVHELARARWACENSFGRISGPFPLDAAHGLLLSALAAVIE